jgi:sRNA-binding regulator protein Hfq
VNRKLIRTTLAEVKEREQQQQQQQHQARPVPQPVVSQSGSAQSSAATAAAAAAAAQQRKRVPPEQTNAESFYYKKQMDARTPMVIVLQDGEQLQGTIEWYDKGSLKLHRVDGPNLLILKHNIKYMYKDQAGQGDD